MSKSRVKWEPIVKPAYTGYRSHMGLVEKYGRGRPWCLWVRNSEGSLIPFSVPGGCSKLSEAKCAVATRYRILQDIGKES